jgi:hypothetical protein
MAVTGVGLFISAAACAPPSAADVCRAHPYGDMRQEVVGAFDIDPLRADAIAPEDLAVPAVVDSEARAVLCYADAMYPKAPPGADRLFDRGVYVLIGDDARLIRLGYRESMPIVEP